MNDGDWRVRKGEVADSRQLTADLAEVQELKVQGFKQLVTGDS